MPGVKRSPKNPILWPNREHDWEAEAAYNGCAIKRGSLTHLVYRAESALQKIGDVELRLSTVGYAVSKNGKTFTNRRLLIEPEHEWERYGCEDPRITWYQGNYYIFYTALSKFPFCPEGIRTAVAITKDFVKIEKHPVSTFNAKAMALFPQLVNGKLAVILTANTDLPPSRIGIAFFDRPEDMWSEAYWKNWYSELSSYELALQRNENDQVEIGAPPVLTKDGWLLICSYIRNYLYGKKIFGVEAVMLDRNNPLKVLSRTDRPFLAPEEEYELYGRVPNVLFPTGAVIDKGILQIYYGAADTTCCMATCRLDELLDEMRATTVKLHRFDGNPILKPEPSHGWETKAVFNPAACQTENRIHLLYRAMSDDDTSVIGYASTKDGVHIDERLPDPVYVPREAFEKKTRSGTGSGCEDPRITRIGDTAYMCYTAYDGINPPRIALTSILIQDLDAKKWNWSKPVLISPPGIDDKDAAIFPRKINGKYVILHRIGLSVWIDFVDDLQFEGKKWLGGRVLMKPRPGIFDSQKIGISGPPIETKKGWLLLYHGISKREDRHYDVRAALLDLKDPRHVIARTKHPIFEPEKSYERSGLVANVVFPCGSAVIDGTLYVYYGGADKVVGVASVVLDQLLERLCAERIGHHAVTKKKESPPKKNHPVQKHHVTKGAKVLLRDETDESIRPWGHYEIIDQGPGFQVKQMTLYPGQRISYQRHVHRAEHWTIVAGEGLTTIDDREERRNIGDMISIPSGTKHRIQNVGKNDLVFIEVQNGDYLGEDDIEHLADDYGRA
jgi:beta-1,2-mannobiose phosphorylase / 1,2-beta-oligomannan phosphorylase